MHNEMMDRTKKFESSGQQTERDDRRRSRHDQAEASDRHQAGSVSCHPFGTLPDGREADLYTMRLPDGPRVTITNYGGIVTSLFVPDRAGSSADVVLGFDTLGAYLKEHSYLGCIVGRYGNRIAGGRFSMDGGVHHLERNEGSNHLHGGVVGFDKALWRASSRRTDAGPRLTLAHTSPDGDQGYPGELKVTVSYTLTVHNELRIDYQATTDRPTHVNLTNHTYFNLSGPTSDSAMNHVVTINADRFIPVADDLLPTGEIRSVGGTPMDFRKPVAIGERIDEEDKQLRIARGYDHTWVLGQSGVEIAPAARVLDPSTGRVMEVLTTEPGLQFYTANHLDGRLVGKSGRPYRRRCAFCLETQHFPDSPNQSDFPSTVLRPGEVYGSTTIYRFTVG